MVSSAPLVTAEDTRPLLVAVPLKRTAHSALTASWTGRSKVTTIWVGTAEPALIGQERAGQGVKQVDIGRSHGALGAAGDRAEDGGGLVGTDSLGSHAHTGLSGEAWVGCTLRPSQPHTGSSTVVQASGRGVQTPGPVQSPVSCWQNSCPVQFLIRLALGRLSEGGPDREGDAENPSRPCSKPREHLRPPRCSKPRSSLIDAGKWPCRSRTFKYTYSTNERQRSCQKHRNVETSKSRNNGRTTRSLVSPPRLALRGREVAVPSGGCVACSG